MPNEPDQPEFPALSDDEIHKSLNDIATLLASHANRLDDQTKALNRLNQVATEARQASFAALEKPDSDDFTEKAIDLIDSGLKNRLLENRQVATELMKASRITIDVLKEAREDRSGERQELWKEEQKIERFKKRLPWFALGAVVLILALSAALPRFLAAYPSGCAILGSVWQSTTTGVDACVSFHP